MILVFLLSIKLVVLADKSVVVQNKVEMNLISHILRKTFVYNVTFIQKYIFLTQTSKPMFPCFVKDSLVQTMQCNAMHDIYKLWLLLG